MNSSGRGITSDSSPSGNTPILSTLHHSSEMDLGLSTPTTGWEEADTALDRALTTTGQRGAPTQYLMHALAITSATSTIKGIMASIH